MKTINAYGLLNKYENDTILYIQNDASIQSKVEKKICQNLVALKLYIESNKWIDEKINVFYYLFTKKNKSTGI